MEKIGNNHQQLKEADDASLELKENFVKEFVADIEKASKLERSSSEVDEDPSDVSINSMSLSQGEKQMLNSTASSSAGTSPEHRKEKPISLESTASKKSPDTCILKAEVPPLLGQ